MKKEFINILHFIKVLFLSVKKQCKSLCNEISKMCDKFEKVKKGYNGDRQGSYPINDDYC